MKSLESLDTKETIYLTTSQNLLTSVGTRTNLPIYGMITSAKSYVFAEIFLTVWRLRTPFSSARLMSCIIWFSKQKSSSSKRRFLWRILREICSCFSFASANSSQFYFWFAILIPTWNTMFFSLKVCVKLTTSESV